MKKLIVLLTGFIFSLSIVCGAWYMLMAFREYIPFAPVMQADIQQINEHFVSLYDLTNRNSKTIIKCRDDYASLTHYISGHDYRHPIEYCPECGLLQQLDIMEDFLDESCQKLAVINDGLDKNSKEYKNNQEVIDKFTVEKLQIKKHLFSMDERAKEVNKIMRDHRITGNETVEPN